MKPTDEFLRHHNVEPPQIDTRHFRAYWRVRTQLDRLLADRAITAREYRAGVEFRDLAESAEAGELGQRGFLGVGGPGGAGAIERLEDRLAAQARLQEIALQLGAIAVALLELAIVKNLSWAAIGRGFSVDPKTARAWCIAAIQALAQI